MQKNLRLTACIVCRRSLEHFGRQLWYLIRTPKAIRMIVLGVALVTYVKARSFLAVDQLVRIYREVSSGSCKHASPVLTV